MRTSVSYLPTATTSPTAEQHRKQIIRQTWRSVEQALDVKATEMFYTRLFAMYPDTRNMFENVDMHMQAQKLYEVIRVAVRFLDHLDQIVPVLQEIGERHLAYGVVREHYSAVTRVFIEVLTSYIYTQWPSDLVAVWRHDVTEAWTWILDLVGTTMADAADRVSNNTASTVALDDANTIVSAVQSVGTNTDANSTTAKEG